MIKCSLKSAACMKDCCIECSDKECKFRCEAVSDLEDYQWSREEILSECPYCEGEENNETQS